MGNNFSSDMLPDQLDKKDLRRATWEVLLGNAEALDFANITVFESSGRGRARIRNAILVAIEKKSLEKIEDEQFRNYLKQAIKGVTDETT